MQSTTRLERPRRASATAGEVDASPSPPSSEPSMAIARALELAAQAGRFDVVAQLGKELEARRLATHPKPPAHPRAQTRGTA